MFRKQKTQEGAAGNTVISKSQPWVCEIVGDISEVALSLGWEFNEPQSRICQAEKWASQRVLEMLQQQENIWKTESFSQELKNKPQQTILLIFLVESHACAGMLSCYSRVQLCVTLWTVARQAPLCMGFSRQEYWSGLPCPPPGDLNDPGIEPPSPASASLAGRFFTANTIWKASKKSHRCYQMLKVFSERLSHCT